MIEDSLGLLPDVNDINLKPQALFTNYDNGDGNSLQTVAEYLNQMYKDMVTCKLGVISVFEFCLCSLVSFYLQSPSACALPDTTLSSPCNHCTK